MGGAVVVRGVVVARCQASSTCHQKRKVILVTNSRSTMNARTVLSVDFSGLFSKVHVKRQRKIKVSVIYTVNQSAIVLLLLGF